MAPTNKINKEVVETSQKFKPAPYTFKYNFKDTILYNLAVGASTQEPEDLKYIYEGAPLFRPLPTMGTLPGIGFLAQLVAGEVPGLEVELGSLLHAEHYLKLHRPLAPEDELTNSYRVEDVLDKGRAAAVLVGVETRNTAGEVVLYNQATLFLLGRGGWGGQRSSEWSTDIREPEQGRDPDHEVEFRTLPDQAALYRLTGDLNPLHIDPKAAEKFKLRSPILHGLCSLGIAARQVAGLMASVRGTPGLGVCEVKVRMSRPVTPGQTLVTQVWEQRSNEGAGDGGGDTLLFRTTIKETNEICLSGGWIRMAEN